MSQPAAPPTSSFLDQLRQVVGPRAVISDPDRLLVFESDGLTQYRERPSAVILPGDGAELQEVIRMLHGAGRAFVPRGAGTGLSGGGLAVNGGVVVATPRMNRILEVDGANRRARVEPGVINAHLTRAAAPHGLYYAPDPSSQSACTLGGNVAENSGGPHCLKYGVTSRYVTGLVVILPDGQRVEFGSLARGGGAASRPRRVGDEPELDLTGLFVGSEGCFGVAVEIEVALLPVPEGVRTLLALFDSLEEAGSAVSEIIGMGLLPAALEIVDRETIQAVEASVFAAGFPTDVAAALVVEFDGVEAGLAAEAEAARSACMAAGAREVRTAADEEERAALWKGRKKAFGAMGRIAPDLLVQDATVPRTRLPEVLARVGEIGRRYDLRVANVFHAGDGNLHPNLLFDRNDPDELARVEKASREIMQVCVEVGGTITGEHGVGLDKRKYLSMVLSPEVMRAMGRVKAVFDPTGRCNPGKVLPDEYLSAPAPGIDLPDEAVADEAVAVDPPRPFPGSEPAAGPAPATIAPRERPRPADVRRRVGRLLGDTEGGTGDDTGNAEGAGSPAGTPVAHPSDPEQAAALLQVAGEEGWRVLPLGAGVALSGGSADFTREADLLVSTGRMQGVLDYEAADLTLRAGAGTSLGALDQVVATESQWLPLDPPGGDRVTLGGVVATGLAGPLATAFGRPRDQLLGLTLVDGRGQVLELGGRVVKNVAGFDLVRLSCGSGGALGLICAVWLRLFPRPGLDRTLEWKATGLEEGLRLGRELATLPLPMAGLELHGDPTAGVRVVLRLMASEAEVDRVEREARGAAGAPSRVVEGSDSRAWVRERSMAEGRGRNHRRWRVGPAQVADCVGRLDSPTVAADLLAGHVRAWGAAGEGDRPTGFPGDLPSEPRARLHAGLRRVFDPRGILPGAWRWRWM